MKKSIRSILLIILSIAILASFTACGTKYGKSTVTASNVDSKVQQNNTNSTQLTGTITAVGSTAMLPLVEEAAKKFMENNNELTINVQGGGSGTGLTQVSNGGCNIGDSDVYANEKIKDTAAASKLVDHQVIAQGFAAVINNNIKVDSLTKDQLKKIFTGSVTNWKDVGGQDMKIIVVNRPSSSGTRSTFVKLVLDGAKLVEGNTVNGDSNGTVLKTVADTPGAISYLGLAYLNDTVKAVKIDGIEPTVDNILAGKYKVWSIGHMYTKGEATGATKAFLDYMKSDEVAKIAKGMSYISGSDITKLSK